MYLKRKVDLFLENWKNDKYKLPLIIKDPRQIGKTKSIMKFATENYKNVIYINFVLEKNILIFVKMDMKLLT